MLGRTSGSACIAHAADNIGDGAEAFSADGAEHLRFESNFVTGPGLITAVGAGVNNADRLSQDEADSDTCADGGTERSASPMGLPLGEHETDQGKADEEECEHHRAEYAGCASCAAVMMRRIMSYIVTAVRGGIDIAVGIAAQSAHEQTADQNCSSKPECRPIGVNDRDRQEMNSVQKLNRCRGHVPYPPFHPLTIMAQRLDMAIINGLADYTACRHWKRDRRACEGGNR